MITITSTTKIHEVALELPQSTRIFEKFKIDYCCGGDQPLAAACASAGVDLHNVLQLIKQVKQTSGARDGTFDLQKASAIQLIGYILDKHHVFTKGEMARLEPLADKVVGAHG